MSQKDDDINDRIVIENGNEMSLFGKAFASRGDFFCLEFITHLYNVRYLYRFI